MLISQNFPIPAVIPIARTLEFSHPYNPRFDLNIKGITV